MITVVLSNMTFLCVNFGWCKGGVLFVPYFVVFGIKVVFRRHCILPWANVFELNELVELVTGSDFKKCCLSVCVIVIVILLMCCFSWCQSIMVLLSPLLGEANVPCVFKAKVSPCSLSFLKRIGFSNFKLFIMGPLELFLCSELRSRSLYCMWKGFWGKYSYHFSGIM